jgi:sugar phosphate isomerase/epimerase
MKNVFLIFILLSSGLAADAQKAVRKPQIGIVQDLEKDTLLVNAGYGYLVESISKWISPVNVTEEKFSENLNTFRNLKINLYAFNIFIPGELKLVGLEVNEPNILSYAETVFKRCQKAGVKMIIWGSGGARRVPDGFDPAKANEQFVSIARKVAALAKKYSIVLALENLNSTETNFITTATQAYEIVKKVDHPNFRLCVDIYHMLKEGESPQIIIKSKAYIVHCDIAEKENRTPPGVVGEDFRPYLKALRDIGYNGKIIIEGRWENVDTQARTSFHYLQKQIDEVYGN